tara:strand:- start:2167 stop:2760 length:594 start_codon:yes stop_codon:yes gene_type:complete
MDSEYEYNIKNIVAVCSIGIIVKLLFGNNYTDDGSNGPASSALWGYGLASMAVFFLMFVQTRKSVEKPSQKTSTQETFLMKINNFYTSMLNILPTLLMFIVLSWLVILNFQFYTQINKGMVTTEYSQFSNISTIMIVFQMAILFKYLYLFVPDRSQSKNSIEEQQSKFASASYLTALLNIIFIGMMNIILVYFSTDG